MSALANKSIEYLTYEHARYGDKLKPASEGQLGCKISDFTEGLIMNTWYTGVLVIAAQSGSHQFWLLLHSRYAATV